MKSAWLQEFHRQWQAARGSRLEPSAVVFSRDWEKLLHEAGVHSGEDHRVAELEARKLAASGHIILGLHRHRHIRRIRLPLEMETWLRSQFGSVAADLILKQSISAIDEASKESHPRFPAEWHSWCGRLKSKFEAGRNARPFYWRKPETIAPILSLVRDLTARDWPPYILIRDVSVALGLDSKAIERHQSVLEASMSQLFEREITLEAMGIMSSNSEVRFHGPLTLHFADGTFQSFESLHHQSSVTAADLDRATHVSTSARSLMTVENSKTTFRHLIAANHDQRVLVVTTSFPTRAVTLLLQKLPLSLLHHHFGDTDPAGYFILLKLRQTCPREVSRFAMDWLDQSSSPTLSEYDRRVISRLLEVPELADCHPDLHQMASLGRRGQFEQEARELPTELFEA